MRGKLACLATLSLLLALTSTSQAATELILNGSFEDSSINPGIFHTLGPGSTLINHWTVTGGTVDYIGTYWQAADGSRSLDLSGNQRGGIAISQSIQTVIGKNYFLSFAMAGNPDDVQGVKSLTVTIGPPSTPGTFTFNSTGHSRANMGWTTKGLYFTAGSTSTSIKFVSNTPGYYGPALDKVSLVAVPEPATMAMSGTAFVVVTGMVLRRRKARVS